MRSEDYAIYLVCVCVCLSVHLCVYTYFSRYGQQSGWWVIPTASVLQALEKKQQVSARETGSVNDYLLFCFSLNFGVHV